MTSVDSLSLILRRLDEIERKLDRMMEELQTAHRRRLSSVLSHVLRIRATRSTWKRCARSSPRNSFVRIRKPRRSPSCAARNNVNVAVILIRVGILLVFGVIVDSSSSRVSQGRTHEFTTSFI